jgi:thioesterase domain-containing protein
MATRYVKEIRKLQPQGPYYLGGTSMGGLVAYEMAQQLLAMGQTVGVMALFDTFAPGHYRMLPPANRFKRRLQALVDRLDLHIGNFLVCEPGERLSYLKVKTVRFKNHVKHWVRNRIKGVRLRVHDFLHPLPREISNIQTINERSIYNYKAKVYPGRVILFRATKRPLGLEPDQYLGWGELIAGGIETYDIDGYHGAICYAPRAKNLAKQLKFCLEREYAAQALGQVPSPNALNRSSITITERSPLTASVN